MNTTLTTLLNSFKKALLTLENGIIQAETLPITELENTLAFMRKTVELSISIIAEYKFNMTFNQHKVNPDLLTAYLQTRIAYLEERVKERVKEHHETLQLPTKLPAYYQNPDTTLLIQQVNKLNDELMQEVKKAYKGLGEVEGVHPETDLWANMQDFYVLGVEDLPDLPTFMITHPYWTVTKQDLDNPEQLKTDIIIAWEQYTTHPTFELQAVFRQSLRAQNIQPLTTTIIKMTHEALLQWAPWYKDLVTTTQETHKTFLALLTSKTTQIIPFTL